MNMIRHHAGDVAFYFFGVPEVAGGQNFFARGGRQHQLVVRAPGDVISGAGNLEVRKVAAAGGGLGDGGVGRLGNRRLARGGRDARLHPRDAGATHRRFNFLQRVCLRGIQHQRLRRQNDVLRIRIALGNFICDGDQAAIFQFTDRRRRCLGKRDQFTQQNFPPLLDDVPDVLLTFRQFRKFSTHRQRAHNQPFAPRRIFLSHGLGQDRLQRDLRRAAVIFADPARELQNFWCHQRLLADDLDDRF